MEEIQVLSDFTDYGSSDDSLNLINTSGSQQALLCQEPAGEIMNQPIVACTNEPNLRDCDKHMSYLVSELKKLVNEENTASHGDPQPSTSSGADRPLFTTGIRRCMEVQQDKIQKEALKN